MAELLHETDQPSSSAVKFGRIVFCCVGTILLAIAGWYSYADPQSNVLVSASCLFFGILCVWLGVALPPKLVAHLGFNLPWFLP